MASIGVTKSASKQQDKSFEAIPEGTYDAVVARIQYKPINLEKTPWLDKQVERGVEAQIGFAFKIVGDKFTNRWLWQDVDAEISDYSKCKLRLYLQELLGENELPESFKFNEEDYDNYVGLPCRIRVKQYWSDKGNENRNSIEDVIAPTVKHPSFATTSVASVAAKDEWEEAF